MGGLGSSPTGVHACTLVVNFAVEDLDNHIDELKKRGLEPRRHCRGQQGRAFVSAYRPGWEHGLAHRRLSRPILTVLTLA